MGAVLKPVRSSLTTVSRSVTQDGAAEGPAKVQEMSEEVQGLPAAGKHPVRLLRLASRYALLVLMFIVWEIISRSSPEMALLLPAPSTVLKGGAELVETAQAR